MYTVFQPVGSNGALAGVVSHSGVPARAPPQRPWANALTGAAIAASPSAWSSWRREIVPRSKLLNSFVSSFIVDPRIGCALIVARRPMVYAGCEEVAATRPTLRRIVCRLLCTARRQDATGPRKGLRPPE